MRAPIAEIEPGSRTSEERFWHALVQSLSFDGWPLKLKIVLYRTTECTWLAASRVTEQRVEMYVGAHVRDRATGESVEVGRLDQVPRLIVADPMAIPRALVEVRKRVMEVVLHELDEQILFVGQRVFDPHEMVACPSEEDLLNHVALTLEKKDDPRAHFRLPRSRPAFLDFPSKSFNPTAEDLEAILLQLKTAGGVVMDYDSVIIEKVRKPEGV